MSDAENTAPAGENNDPGSDFKAPASQADLDRIIQDRVARVKSSYSDYEDLKARASQVDTFESRIKELETTNTDLDGKVKTFETEKARDKTVAEVAKDKGVPASALRGSTREEIEAHADEIAALIKPSGPVVLGQERTPDKVPDSPNSTFVKNLFGKD